MSDKNKKSSLEEAKINFEEIQKFAQEQAAAQLEEQVAERLKNLFEDITININGEDVDVMKDGEPVASVSDTPNANPETEFNHEENSDEDPEGFVISDDEDEISLDETLETIQNENMEEMNNMKMEDAPIGGAPAAGPVPTDVNAAAAPAPVDGSAAPVDGSAAPVDFNELLSKLDTLTNVLLQQNGGASADNAGATAGNEQEYEVIDDEAGAPAGGPGAPAATAPNPQMQEEIEIEDYNGNQDKNYIDEMEGQMLEIVDEDETPETGPAMEEMRSLSNTVKRTGDRNLKLTTMKDEKGHHAPVTSLKESNIKAQNESKLDELIKENSSLKNKVKELQAKEKEFEGAFVGLRTQFNEMQLFNGKLALANKVLMNGGLTTEEKIRVCEQFDSATTFEEANKLFKNIIKENNIKVGDGKEKIKSSLTNTVKPKSTTEPLYESEEARRAKVLAGINKAEDKE